MDVNKFAERWVASMEEHQPGAAQHVDATNAEVDIDITDVNPDNIKESVPGTAPGIAEAISASKEKDISQEEFDVSIESGDVGAKTIDSDCVDPATGLPRRYIITGFNASNNPALQDGDKPTQLAIILQNGTIPENGLNGVTAEDLLKVVREIFTCYQESKFACEENAVALAHIDGALAAQAERQARREAEGVEGTHVGN